MAEWKSNKRIDEIREQVNNLNVSLDELVRDGFLEKKFDEKTKQFLYTTTRDPVKLKKAKELFGL